LERKNTAYSFVGNGIYRSRTIARSMILSDISGTVAFAENCLIYKSLVMSDLLSLNSRSLQTFGNIEAANSLQ
jgi:hypothetical protein